MMNKLKNSFIRFLIKRTCLDTSTIYAVLRQGTKKKWNFILKIIIGSKKYEILF